MTAANAVVSLISLVASNQALQLTVCPEARKLHGNFTYMAANGEYQNKHKSSGEL